MSRSIGHGSFIRAATALVVLAACTPPKANGECAWDGECEASQLCNLQTARCIERARRAVSLEVLPPSGNKQGWVQQEYPSVRRENDGRLLLKLDETVSIQGKVYASDQPSWGVPARILAWRESLLTGRPRVQLESAAVDGKAEEAAGFVVWVGLGQTHTFYVSPSEPFAASYPPAPQGSIRATDHVQRDFVLDGGDRSTLVTGKVLSSNGAPLPFSVQVRAHAPATWLRSTVGLTCSLDTPERCDGGKFQSEQAGEFAFRIPAGIHPYVLRVENVALSAARLEDLEKRAGSRPLPFVPTLECQTRVLGLLEPIPDGKPRHRLGDSLRLPPFAFARFYRISVVGDDGRPVTGARVRMSTTLTAKAGAGFEGCTAHFERTGTTGAEGKVNLPLLPGDAKERTYQVLVTPPADSAYASRVIASFGVGATGGEVATPITLGRRHVVSGRVVGPDGKGVAGAAVEAVGMALARSAPLSPPPTTSAAVTSDDGSFTLHADSGSYNVLLTPPAGSGLAASTMVSLQVAGGLEGLLFELPPPVGIVGRLEDAKGKPAGGFMVRAFDLLPDALGPAGIPASFRAVAQAAAVTDANGEFRLLLPTPR
ncbi:MAG: carboxypeptidase regulatory-like domain-containing protein [Deltaproteobacteria bacterium]|nr:carboxypeptidase regulatory-like domain-containing protein [Deltaproteobacteria bacterium]